jgi:rubrerythrin
MKSYRIASDYPVDVKPNEKGSERRYTNTQKGKASHKELLTQFRSKPTPRTIHSDGFLCVSEFAETAYSCPSCGFQGIFKRSDCIRCGTKL